MAPILRGPGFIAVYSAVENKDTNSAHLTSPKLKTHPDCIPVVARQTRSATVWLDSAGFKPIYSKHGGIPDSKQKILCVEYTVILIGIGHNGILHSTSSPLLQLKSQRLLESPTMELRSLVKELRRVISENPGPHTSIIKRTSAPERVHRTTL